MFSKNNEEAGKVDNGADQSPSKPAPSSPSPQRAEHLPHCNYWTQPIGAPGCVCVPRGDEDVIGEAFDAAYAREDAKNAQPTPVESTGLEDVYRDLVNDLDRARNSGESEMRQGHMRWVATWKALTAAAALGAAHISLEKDAQLAELKRENGELSRQVELEISDRDEANARVQSLQAKITQLEKVLEKQARARHHDLKHCVAIGGGCLPSFDVCPDVHCVEAREALADRKTKDL